MESTRVPRKMDLVEKGSEKELLSDMEMPNVDSFIGVEEAVTSFLAGNKGHGKKISQRLAEGYSKCLNFYVEHDVDSAAKYVPKIKE